MLSLIHPLDDPRSTKRWRQSSVQLALVAHSCAIFPRLFLLFMHLHTLAGSKFSVPSSVPPIVLPPFSPFVIIVDTRSVILFISRLEHGCGRGGDI